MKIGLISDTHDHIIRAREAVAILNRAEVDVVLHAGDYCSPFLVRELSGIEAPLHGIAGNNDGDLHAIGRAFAEIGARLEAQWWETELGERRILMMHEPRGVDAVAAAGGYDLVVYGHTHRHDLRWLGGTTVVNPGEVCGWLTGEPTLAFYDTVRNEVDLHAF